MIAKQLIKIWSARKAIWNQFFWWKNSSKLSSICFSIGYHIGSNQISLFILISKLKVKYCQIGQIMLNDSIFCSFSYDFLSILYLQKKTRIIICFWSKPNIVFILLHLFNIIQLILANHVKLIISIHFGSIRFTIWNTSLLIWFDLF